MTSNKNKINLVQWIIIIIIISIIIYLLYVNYKDIIRKNLFFNSTHEHLQKNYTTNNDMFIPLIDNFYQKTNNLDSDENYQFTENTSHYLNNAFNDYIKSKKSYVSEDQGIINLGLGFDESKLPKEQEKNISYVPSEVSNSQIQENSFVFFDISLKEEYLGRINIELFNNIVPDTVDNFLYMVKNHYKGSIFHRIIKDFVIQGGDFLYGNGTGSISKYGNKFKDENFDLKHDEKYLLSMANSGPNTNGCQFFITLDILPHLDNKHVVFGKIYDEESKQLIDKLAEVKTDNDRPIIDCIISDCGIYVYN